METLSSGAQNVCQQIDKGDAWAESSQSVEVRFDAGRLYSVEDVQTNAISLRLFQDGRVGHAMTNALDAEARLIQNARESSQFGEEADFALPGPSAHTQPVEVFDPAIERLTKEQMVAQGETLVQLMRDIDSRAKVDVSVSKAVGYSHLANTSGLSEGSAHSQYSLGASVFLVDEGHFLELWEADLAVGVSTAHSAEQIVEALEWRYRHALHKSSIESGYYPVLFTPRSVDLLLDSLQIAMNARTLYKGISVLEGKEGQPVASPLLSIQDNPHLAMHPNSQAWDDEGVPTRVLPLLEQGVFQNFICDLAIGQKLNRPSTGHGYRSVRSNPSPSYSSWVMAPGQTSLEDMVASIEKGLLLCDFLGQGMGNVLAGDFSVNLEMGFLIEKGQIKGRVRDVMIAGNAFEVLSNLQAVENQSHKEGSNFYGHVLAKSVSVAS